MKRYSKICRKGKKWYTSIGDFPIMELTGLEVDLGGQCASEGLWRPRTLLRTAVAFINTLHFSYTKFIKQHEIKSSTKEKDAIRGCSKQVRTCCYQNMAYCFTANSFISRKSTL